MKTRKRNTRTVSRWIYEMGACGAYVHLFRGKTTRQAWALAKDYGRLGWLPYRLAERGWFTWYYDGSPRQEKALKRAALRAYAYYRRTGRVEKLR